MFLVCSAKLTAARASLGEVITRRLSFATGTGVAAPYFGSMSGNGVTPGFEFLQGLIVHASVRKIIAMHYLYLIMGLGVVLPKALLSQCENISE